MAKVIYKNKVGALHIGGGRFFYANEPVEVTDEEKEQLLEAYEDLEEVSIPELHTKASLKKLNKEQQEAIIALHDGDPATPRNEEERIALILDLQEKKGSE